MRKCCGNCWYYPERDNESGICRLNPRVVIGFDKAGKPYTRDRYHRVWRSDRCESHFSADLFEESEFDVQPAPNQYSIDFDNIGAADTDGGTGLSVGVQGGDD
jgi:hypothetical protein